MSPIFSSVANPAQQQPLHTNSKMVSVEPALKKFPASSLKRQRRSLGTTHPANLATDSSDEEEDDDEYSNAASLSNNSHIRKKQCPNSRHVSISAVAPTTHNFVSPPSPPHSFGEFDRAIEFYSDSDGGYYNCLDEDEEEDGMTRPRNSSISIASMRRRRASMLNQTGGGGAAFTCSSHRKRRSPTVPHQDLVARARCFEYLVSSIDEVWAQYCSITSYAEDEMYGEEDENLQPRSAPYSRKTLREDLPASPTSLYQEEYDDENSSDSYYSSTNESQGPRTPYSHSEPFTHSMSPKCAMNTVNNSVCLPPSEQPDSVRLLNLKKRLMNAKYFLQDLTDSEDLQSSATFWNRWDMIKYAAIELVEENGDDDDVVESVTDELEAGRHYRGSY